MKYDHRSFAPAMKAQGAYRSDAAVTVLRRLLLGEARKRWPDQWRGLAPVPKLAGQVLAAAIPTAFGVWIDHFTLPFLGAVDVPAVIGVPLTIIWIVAVMNMVNFLDGMDGLAAGSAAMVFGAYTIIAFIELRSDCHIGTLVSEHASPLTAVGGEDAGGQNVHVEAMARQLAARGHEVVVHTRRDDESLPDRVSATT